MYSVPMVQYLAHQFKRVVARAALLDGDTNHLIPVGTPVKRAKFIQTSAQIHQLGRATEYNH